MKDFYWPVENTTHLDISSPYGARTNPISSKIEIHKGADIAAPRGTIIRAVGTGPIIVLNNNGHEIYGIFIVQTVGDLRVNYWHNSENLVRNKVVVEKGQPIAKVGDTGYTTGCHLHLQFCSINSASGEGTIDPINIYESMILRKQLEDVKFTMNLINNARKWES